MATQSPEGNIQVLEYFDNIFVSIDASTAHFSPSINTLYIQLNISFKSWICLSARLFFEVFLKAYKKLDSLSLYSVSSSKKVWSKLTFSQKE